MAGEASKAETLFVCSAGQYDIDRDSCDADDGN